MPKDITDMLRSFRGRAVMLQHCDLEVFLKVLPDLYVGFIDSSH